MRARDAIVVHRAREHNLRDVDVAIPRDGMTVVTGVSGSGKSTLAFDIVFAEGQRRYLESLNAYARQFVQPAGRPDVDAIFGIPPTVAIEQRTSRGGRKSTVGTLTEVHHFLRLLYVKLGVQHCPDCQVPIEPQSADAIAARLLREAKGRRVEFWRRWSWRARATTPTSRSGPLARATRSSASTASLADGALAAARPLPRAHDRAARRQVLVGANRNANAPTAAAGAGVRQGRGTRRRQGRVRVFSTRRACPGAAAASPNPIHACSRTTPSTAGASRASARAWASRASTPSSRARRSGGTTGSRARRRLRRL
jgi:excinuclease ABC subunit A